MAAGFKQATVNASDVPATQTHFPAYVDLSRLGITTLAEAQSVRVYADSGKTTEWAREIVSVDEMHVKVPSLTSTVTMYVDWDGVSADYAATDTYGRNAVWTNDFSSVYHLQDLTLDSSGNAYTLTNVNTVGNTATQIEQGADFGTANTNKALNVAQFPFNAFSSSKSFSFWIRMNTEIGSSFQQIMSADKVGGGSRDFYHFYYDYNSGTRRLVFIRTSTGTGTLTYNIALGTTNLHAFTWTYDSSDNNMRLYYNGSLVTTVAATGVQTSVSGTFNNLALARYTDINNAALIHLSADMDEVRVINAARSANWITTEYNNQSDEPGFWGTWTDVGGGGGVVLPQFKGFARL
jgi:hypothetical protein